MSKKRKLSSAVEAIKSLAKGAAAAVLTTSSAGKPSLADLGVPVPAKSKGSSMAKKRTSARGRKQDRARVASGQNYEVRYEAKKTGKSKKAVKRAVKRVGNSRKKVERALRG